MFKVYYLVEFDEDDFEYDQDDWDELSLLISIDGKLKPNSSVLIVSYAGDGWIEINEQMTISEWYHELTERAKQRFLEACFQKI